MQQELFYRNQTPEGKFVFSASQLELFKDCPRKYYYEYLSGIKVIKIKWPGTIFGKAAHEVLDKALMQYSSQEKVKIIEKFVFEEFKNVYLKMKEPKDEFDKFLTGRNYDEDYLIKFGGESCKFVFNFIIKYFNNHKFITEEKLQVDIDENIILSGIIDLRIISLEDNIQEILDFKFTKYPEQYFFVDWEYKLQKHIYEFIIEKKYDIKPVAFNYLVSSSADSLIFLKKKIKDDESNVIVINKINEIYNFIKKKNFEIYNPSIEKCKWCDFKKNCPIHFTGNRKKF